MPQTLYCPEKFHTTLSSAGGDKDNDRCKNCCIFPSHNIFSFWGKILRHFCNFSPSSFLLGELDRKSLKVWHIWATATQWPGLHSLPKAFFVKQTKPQPFSFRNFVQNLALENSWNLLDLHQYPFFYRILCDIFLCRIAKVETEKLKISFPSLLEFVLLSVIFVWSSKLTSANKFIHGDIGKLDTHFGDQRNYRNIFNF